MDERADYTRTLVSHFEHYTWILLVLSELTQLQVPLNGVCGLQQIVTVSRKDRKICLVPTGDIISLP